MARMLGRAHKRPSYCPRDYDFLRAHTLSRRIQRHREDQAFRRSLPAEQAEARREWLAHLDALFDSLFGPSDCRHGCNGDCVTSGSDRCNFTCH